MGSPFYWLDGKSLSQKKERERERERKREREAGYI
jgi:hypothetical protein